MDSKSNLGRKHLQHLPGEVSIIQPAGTTDQLQPLTIQSQEKEEEVVPLPRCGLETETYLQSCQHQLLSPLSCQLSTSTSTRTISLRRNLEVDLNRNLERHHLQHQMGEIPQKVLSRRTEPQAREEGDGIRQEVLHTRLGRQSYTPGPGFLYIPILGLSWNPAVTRDQLR